MKNMMLFAALMTAACGATSAELAANGNDAGGDAPIEEPTEPGETCEPGAFLGCEGDAARTCGATGTTIISQNCGASGCNDTAQRCNECVPNAATCAGDDVQTCNADGLVASTETCKLGCSTDGGAAHCTHIVPQFLPTVCDAPATLPELVIPTGQANTIDTNNAANCTGGVITQLDGPEVCVVRYGTISIQGPLLVTGQRAIAFVADGALGVSNIIDVSATRRLSGPGGRRIVSGAAASTGGGAGGGGAGGKQTGGDGGASGEFNSGVGSGGVIVDPLITQLFEGGARAPSVNSIGGNYRPTGGGGGGALMLVSCTAEVQMAGTIEAGGGGGDGGGDGSTSSTLPLFGGAGGGAGGYVVMQGATVRVTGKLFANGGGGGGGCSTSNCIGVAGEDGAQIKARGGAGQGTGAAGGAGGFGATAPVIGTAGTPPGGGGGSVGRFQIFTPAGSTPFNTATAQPAFEPNRTIDLR